MTQSSTKAEREAALQMLGEISDGGRRITLGADKGYQEREFLEGLRQRRVVPQVAGMWQTKFRGRTRVEWMFRLAVSALNLRRMQRLLAVGPG